MRIMDRDVRQLVLFPFQSRHYVAMYNMMQVHPRFVECFRRYITNSGTYPYSVAIRSPLGEVSPTLYSYHDMLTVHEIFCRQDYRLDEGAKVIVDIGSNIGISALYFLTRNPNCKCYLFEPVPANVEKLKKNLSRFEDRYVLREAAVADRSGTLEFGTEPSGRYGGLMSAALEPIKVQCLHINEVLEEVLRTETAIDMLKIDTEGVEEATIAAIDPRYLARIRLIVYEGNDGKATKTIKPAAGL